MPKNSERASGSAVRPDKPISMQSATSGRFLDPAVKPRPSKALSPEKKDQVRAVMRGAADSGLTLSKNGRIAGRVSPELIERAKARTGLQSDTELVEFALANVALDDDFSQVFRELKGTVDPDLDLGV